MGQTARYKSQSLQHRRNQPNRTYCGGGQQELKILVPEATKKGYDTATYGDSINMAYPNSKTRRGRVGHGVAQTLTTGDAQQVVVVGNYSPSGHNASKVVDPTGLAPTVMENHGTVTAITSPRIAAMRGQNPDNPSDRTAGALTEQRLEIGSEETSNTLTTVQKDNLVVEPKGDEYDRDKAIREILCLLWQKVGEETFCEWAIRGLWCIFQAEILQYDLYAKGVFENWEQQPNLSCFAQYISKDKRIDITENDLRELWKEWQFRCSSYRRQLSEQQFREFKSFMQKLPHKRASQQVFMQSLWETYGRRIGILRQALSEIQKIWEPVHSQEMQRNDYRIRKLTERECFRLQGVKEQDFENVAKNQSPSSLYHLAGDSIVTSCLMAIFGQLFGIDYNEKITELVTELKQS